MATIVTRLGKGSPLTNTEVDANLTNINAETVDNSGVFNLRPSLDIDLVGSKTVSPLLNFSRPSIGTYYDLNGLLKIAGANQPRFDYDPITKEFKGLLVEEQRTNLLTYSDQFENAAWFKNEILPFGSGSATNIITAPDGTLTADKIVPSQVNTNHYIYQNVPVTSGLTYTYSFYAKKAEYNFTFTYILALNISVYWDLNSGVAGSGASIENIGGGWYKCKVSGVSTTTGNASIRIYAQNSNTPIFAGDGTSGIYIWGAQLEQGSTATSYIPTTSSTVTRYADQLSINKNSNWFNSANGTLSLSHDAISGQPLLGDGSTTILSSLGAGTINIDYSNTQLSVVTQSGQTNNTTGIFNFDSDLYIGGNSITKSNAHVKYLKFYPNNVISSTPDGSGVILDSGFALLQEDGSVLFQE